MPIALTRYRRAPTQNVGGGLMVGAGVAAVVLVAMLFLPAMETPSFVSRITVMNPTEYGIEVDVSTPARDHWLALGGFSPQSTRALYEVLDEGKTWVFRFTYGGQEMGQMTMARQSMRRADWLVTIPKELGDRLWAAGAPASARG